MYLNEKVIHYAAAFLERYDVQNKSHQDAIKQLRLVSNLLLEELGKPKTINVIRHKKED